MSLSSFASLRDFKFLNFVLNGQWKRDPSLWMKIANESMNRGMKQNILGFDFWNHKVNGQLLQSQLYIGMESGKTFLRFSYLLYRVLYRL